MKLSTIILIIILSIGLLLLFQFEKDKTQEPIATEKFIEGWLTNKNGTLATYMKDTESKDEDLVKGREALSETLGLWMEYALQKEDKELFEESYGLLNRYFLEKSGFIHWKLTETGQSEISANALVDDLRIILALIQAAEKWNDIRYEKTAMQIGKYIGKFNNYQGVLTDFYEKNDQYASHIITLSYIEPEALEQMKKHSLVDEEIYINMIEILKNTPIDSMFYPKSYNVQNKKYIFDENVNMVDQSLVAIYRAKSRFSTNQFIDFIKKELDTNGVIYGQYNRYTGEPTVKYESPAIYGLLILYSLEVDDEELIKVIFEKMNRFQNTGPKFYGGYSVYQGNTHIFDNLIPLVAKRKVYNEGLIDYSIR